MADNFFSISHLIHHETDDDDAFVYELTAKVDGSMLDIIESAYFKFRRRIRDIK